MKHNKTSSCHLEISTQRTFNPKIKKQKSRSTPTFTGDICGIFSFGGLLALCQGFGILAVLLLTLPGTEFWRDVGFVIYSMKTTCPTCWTSLALEE